MINDKPMVLNEIMISSGNENNPHFSFTYETESKALATDSYVLYALDNKLIRFIYLRVKRF